MTEIQITITDQDREQAAATISAWEAAEAASNFPRTPYQRMAGFAAAIAHNIAKDLAAGNEVTGYQLARFLEADRRRDEIVSRLPA